jgi:putative MATE family efflux protein
LTPPTAGGGRALDRQILRLAIPAALTVAADPIYDLTDTAILGHLGTDALAGAALASVVLASGYAIFIFLLYGTTATVARLLGGGRPADAAHHGVQALWLAAGCGTVVAVAMWPLAPALVAAMGGHGAVADAALTYLRISLLGFPAFFLVMAGAGYLRGIQDLRTPLVVSTTTVALNVVVEVALVYGLDRGVGASAAGTAIAKWAGALVYVALVARSARSQGVRLRPERTALGAVSRTGAPLFVRTVALRATFALAVAVAGRIGRLELAAYAVAFQISSTLAYVAEGLEVAAHTLIGHALGSGDAVAARSTGRRILRLGLLLGVADLVVIVAAHRVLPPIFTADHAVRDLTATSLLWVAAMQPVATVSFALDGILIGAGDLRFLAAAMVAAGLGFAALAAVVLAAGLGLGALWAAVIAFMAMRAVGLGARFRTGRWAQVGTALSGSGSTPTP